MAAPPISPVTLQALAAYSSPSATRPASTPPQATGSVRFEPPARVGELQPSPSPTAPAGNDPVRAAASVARETLIAIQSAASGGPVQQAAPVQDRSRATPYAASLPGSTLNLTI